MGYPVTLVGGTDELRLTPDGRVYHVGERIDDLSDAQRTHLQGNGIRFAAVHEERPSAPVPAAPADHQDVTAEHEAPLSVREGKKA